MTVTHQWPEAAKQRWRPFVKSASAPRLRLSAFDNAVERLRPHMVIGAHWDDASHVSRTDECGGNPSIAHKARPCPPISKRKMACICKNSWCHQSENVPGSLMHRDVWPASHFIVTHVFLRLLVCHFILRTSVSAINMVSNSEVLRIYFKVAHCAWTAHCRCLLHPIWSLSKRDDTANFGSGQPHAYRWGNPAGELTLMP